MSTVDYIGSNGFGAKLEEPTMTPLAHYTAMNALGELAGLFAASGELDLASTFWTAVRLAGPAS